MKGLVLEQFSGDRVCICTSLQGDLSRWQCVGVWREHYMYVCTYVPLWMT